MPWQRQVVDVALEIGDDGLPAYREVWITVPRQSGKTVLLLALEVERCLSWPGIQRVAYTAQTGWDARKKLLDDQVPMVQASKLRKSLSTVKRTNGNEGMVFHTGSRVDVMASNSSAGHGRTIDLGVIDEAWDDEDDRREQAILPAMVTRPSAQLVGASTQGTDTSVYLNRKVESGREASMRDSGEGIAYFEWSIPEDADVDDPEVWWRYLPALGWTITERAVAHARQTMEDGEFRRAFGNQRTAGGGERVIPPELWDQVVSPVAAPERNLTFGLDVNHDRSSAAVCVSDGETIELVDHRAGTGWLVDRCVQLVESWSGDVVVDGGGPAASIADELETAGVTVRRLTGGEVAVACARMYDGIADQKVKVRPAQPLDDAVAGLAKKTIGDRFVWARAASTADVTPLMAATLARSRPGHNPEMKPIMVVT